MHMLRINLIALLFVRRGTLLALQIAAEHYVACSESGKLSKDHGHRPYIEATLLFIFKLFRSSIRVISMTIFEYLNEEESF